MRRTAALLLALMLLLAGCGGDDESGDAGSSEVEVAGSLTSDDGAEIQDVIRTWLTEGGCEHMTDKFLEDQTFNDDPEEACETFEQSFSEPVYGPEDVIVSDIRGNGNSASAVISDEISNVEATYKLKRESGEWKIDSVDL